MGEAMNLADFKRMAALAGITGGGGGSTGNMRALAVSGAAASVTGTLTKTALATIAVPAGTLTANGRLEVFLDFEMTQNVNAKTLSLQFGGADVAGTFGVNNSGNSFGAWLQYTIQNRNALAAQATLMLAWDSPSNATFRATDTRTINTANAQNLVVFGQLGDVGDTITLRSYRVTLINP